MIALITYNLAFSTWINKRLSKKLKFFFIRSRKWLQRALSRQGQEGLFCRDLGAVPAVGSTDGLCVDALGRRERPFGEENMIHLWVAN